MQTDVKDHPESAQNEGDYADEATRMSYEVAAAVRELDRTLPPETRGTIPLRSVSFPDEALEKAETVLFFANDFMNTNAEETIFFITPRTQQMLDAIGVPYEIVPAKSQGTSG